MPWVATLLTAGMAIVFLLTGDPTWLIAAANLTYLIGIGLPSVAVWLLRRDAPELARPYRAPRGTIVLGLIAAGVWASATVLGFEQFGLPTVLVGLGFAYSGSLLYALAALERPSPSGPAGSRALAAREADRRDAAGAGARRRRVPAGRQPRLEPATRRSITVLEDIFVAVALLTITVGLVLPGHDRPRRRRGGRRRRAPGRGTLADLSSAMQALGRGDLDAARARLDTTPVVVQSRDELGSMAANFNSMQVKLAGAAHALDGAREGLRTTRDRLQRNIAQQAAIAQLGERALEGTGVDELLSDATRTVANVLAVEIAAMFELDPDSGVLGLRASVGLPAEVTEPTFEHGPAPRPHTRWRSERR